MRKKESKPVNFFKIEACEIFEKGLRSEKSFKFENSDEKLIERSKNSDEVLKNFPIWRSFGLSGFWVGGWWEGAGNFLNFFCQIRPLRPRSGSSGNF